MYRDCSFGEYLYELRRSLNITQEELADGICTSATVSRIENGTQEPTGSMKRRLLERLGDPGFFIGYYSECGSLKAQVLKQKILEHYENNSIEKFELDMEEFKGLADCENPHEIQFLGFAEYLYFNALNPQLTKERYELISLMRLTHNRYKDIVTKGILLDYTELLIHNNILLTKSGNEAMPLFMHLIGSFPKQRHILPKYWKIKAGLYNNLSLYILRERGPKIANYAIDRAIGMGSMEGGTLFLTRLLHSKIIIKSALGEETRSCYYTLKRCYEILPKWIKKQNPLDKLMSEDGFLKVF